ncbi:MAG: glycine cleavage system protein GcvH, partial [bacterium]
MIPEELAYTKDHEWVRDSGGDAVRFGITDYAQDALGDIVYVSLPKVGDAIVAHEPCGEVESTKSVSEIYAPVSGQVTAVNDLLSNAPETINSDPYGDGWIVEVSVTGDRDGLMDAAAYREFTGGE